MVILRELPEGSLVDALGGAGSVARNLLGSESLPLINRSRLSDPRLKLIPMVCERSAESPK